MIGFLANQHAEGRINYAALEKEGLPIGTGVIEATAKTLVNVRMKRAGSRFSQQGGKRCCSSAARPPPIGLIRSCVNFTPRIVPALSSQKSAPHEDARTRHGYAPAVRYD